MFYMVFIIGIRVHVNPYRDWRKRSYNMNGIILQKEIPCPDLSKRIFFLLERQDEDVREVHTLS